MLTEWDLELPPNFLPRSCQITAVGETTRVWEGGDNSTLLVMPTGVGKTKTAAMIIQKAIHDHGWRTLFITHRRDLVRDAYDTFGSFGLLAAIEMANLNERDQAIALGDPEVVVATVQTLAGDRLLLKEKQRFDLIVIDEAHRSLSLGYENLLDHFEGYKLLGLTATPDGSRRNLGNRFQSVAYQLKLKTAIEAGWLCRIIRRTIKTTVNLKDLRKTKGDFNDAELAERILPAIEGLAFNIGENMGDRQTVVFMPDLATCSAMAEMLRKLGVKARYVAGTAGDYGMSYDERNAIDRMFKTSKFQALVSNELICEGWDNPTTSCVAICCPTLQRWKYVQRAGRGFRTAEGKENFLLLDFDWQADESCKRLCTPVCLFEDSFDEPTKRRAKKRMEDSPEGDLLDEMEIAEKEEKLPRQYREVAIDYTGKFSQKWATVDTDPVGVAKILGEKVSPFKPLYKDTMGGPATDPQVHRLTSLGVKNAAGMSKWGASKLIDKLDQRRRDNRSSWQQIHAMVRLGVDDKQARSLTIPEASLVIAQAKLKQRLLFDDLPKS